jgi:transposase
MNEELEFKEKLQKLILKYPKSHLAESFGVSRVTIYKWLRKYKIHYLKNSSNFDKTKSKNDIADELLKS